MDDDDATPTELIIKYEVDAIDSSSGAASQVNFCGRGQSLQIIQGSQLSGPPVYTTTFGVRFEGDSPISSVTVFVVGNTEVRDTLLSNTTGVLENVQLILADSEAVNAYVDLFIDYEGKRYRSVFFDNSNRVGIIPDATADQTLEFSLSDDLRCGSSPSLIIETKLSYDGYVYNISDRNDSIKVDGFSATIFNNSF
jgi:hypothetical protein